MVTLRGITWDHPRGRAPLVATAAAFARDHDVRITWDARSLYAFGAQPLEQVAQDYDLRIIDHPFARSQERRAARTHGTGVPALHRRVGVAAHGQKERYAIDDGHILWYHSLKSESVY
jgi:hypothetical protein